MKTSLRSFIAVALITLGFAAAAASAHAGQGAAYWQNRAATKAAGAKTPASAVAAKSADKAVQPSGEACTGSCCTVSKAGS